MPNPLCARTSALREERGDEAATDRARWQRGLQTTHTFTLHPKGNPVTLKVFYNVHFRNTALPTLWRRCGGRQDEIHEGLSWTLVFWLPTIQHPSSSGRTLFPTAKDKGGQTTLRCPTPIPVNGRHEMYIVTSAP